MIVLKKLLLKSCSPEVSEFFWDVEDLSYLSIMIFQEWNQTDNFCKTNHYSFSFSHSLTERKDNWYYNIEYFIIQWIKPIWDAKTPQTTRNYDAIQIIDSLFWKIVLKLDQLILQLHFTIEF